MTQKFVLILPVCDFNWVSRPACDFNLVSRYCPPSTGSVSFFSMMVFIFSKWIHVFPVIFNPWLQRTCHRFLWHYWSTYPFEETGWGMVCLLPISYRIKYFSSVSLFLPNVNSSVTNVFWDLYYLHRFIPWRNETPSFQFQYSSFSHHAQSSPFYHSQ